MPYEPVTDRRKRRVAKAQAKRIISDTECWAEQLPLAWQLEAAPVPTPVLAANEIDYWWQGDTNVYPFERLTALTARERFLSQVYKDTPKSGWEAKALKSFQDAFSAAKQYYKQTWVPLTDAQLVGGAVNTSTVTVRMRKPVAMSIRDEGL